jgi:hypothetical protein
MQIRLMAVFYDFMLNGRGGPMNSAATKSQRRAFRSILKRFEAF